jgi:signal transduction histidine kinase
MFVFTNMRGNRANLEFASIIAHKLKNSLSAVKWSLRMYLDGDFGHITDEQRGVVSRLYEKNEAMILTLNNLLHFNDIENGVYSFRRTKVDLVPLIQAIINDYRDELNKKNIELDFKKPDFTFPKLMLDKEKIDSAIQNIFDNAAKYTPEDGSIKVFLKSDDKEVEIQISNSGPGIPKENQRNIFSTKMARLRKGRHNGSTGLGLFLARKVIMAHGGKIWFKSEDGQGNCFYIKLPIYK